MSFTVRPFKDILAATKDGIDAMLVPIRARHAKAKAEMQAAKLEEQMIALERDINELCTSKELDFDRIIDKMNQYDLAERRAKQITKLVGELFPAEG